MKLLLKAGISLAFFFVLFSFVNTNELLAVFSRVNWYFFAASFALTPAMIAASCAKWKLVLDQSGTRVPFAELFRLYLIGYFFSNILPSTVGGDVVRSFYAGRRIENQAFSAVAIFIERFSGIILLLLLVLLLPLLRFEWYASPFITIPAVTALAIIVVVAVLWRAGNPMAVFAAVGDGVLAVLRSLVKLPVLRLLNRFVPMLEKVQAGVMTKLGKVHRELQNAMREIGQNGTLFANIVLLTVLFYLLAMLNVWVSYRAFNTQVDLLSVCILVPVALFVAQIPVSLLANLGYFESVFVAFFLLAGVTEAESLAMGLLLRTKLLTVGLVGYFVYLAYKGSRKGDADELGSFLGKDEEKA